MTDEELFKLQMELECIGLDERGRLCRIPGPCPDGISTFCLAKLHEGYRCFVREDISDDTRSKLLSLNPDDVFKEPNIPCAILNCGAPFHGITGVMPELPEASYEEPVVWNSELSAFVILKDQIVASKAFSSRENEKAAELAVETVPEFRRQGLAIQVSIAWRDYQRREKRIPFYSYELSNKASQALAEKLKVVEVFEFLGYS